MATEDSHLAAPGSAIGLICLLASMALLLAASPAGAAGRDEVSAEPEVTTELDATTKQRAPCPELEGADTPTLDNFRTGVERSVCLTAWYFDSLFGVLPENEIVETRTTHGRLRAGALWDERDGFSEEFTLNAQVQMPVAEQRLLAVFGRDTDEAFIEGGSGDFDSVAFTEEDEERSWLLGLGFEPMRGTRSRLSLGAGVRLRTPPDPYVQASYWYQDRLGEQLLFRARQTVFWENEDGFGTATRLVLERALGATRMLRWGNHLRVSEATDGMRWNTNLTLFNALSASRAVALRGAIRGETGREVNPIEYQVLLIHRQRIYREWLFLELRGGGGWIRREQSEPREFVPEAGVVFEMSFGRHPRERRQAAPD
ncbi:MAG: hypothetical protein NDI84_08375 [Steroidobacteraceae bacterium]|nr:hypothetical protein [Steroidobacteraceae bacterium]